MTPSPAARAAALACAATLSACAVAPQPEPELARLRQQVHDTETAFAQSMARRDLAAFGAFIAEDAVFLNGGQPLRGKAAVLAHWGRYFEGPQAPFSWRPALVEVTGGGTLAQSTGPVSDASGRQIAVYYSTWRREPDGRWRIVLDNGYAVRPDGSAAD